MIHPSRLLFSEVRASDPGARRGSAASAREANAGLGQPATGCGDHSNESLSSGHSSYDGAPGTCFSPAGCPPGGGARSSPTGAPRAPSGRAAGAQQLRPVLIARDLADSAETNTSDLSPPGGAPHAGANRSSGANALGPHRAPGGAPRHARPTGYRRLWAAVCAPPGGGERGASDPGCAAWREVSVEELIRAIQAAPPGAPAADAVRGGLAYLDSRAFAALLKGLAKAGLGVKATELFDEIRSLDASHELSHLADVYTYTTAISQCSSHHQLRRALELVSEMRARGVALNVHTYSALLNVCLKCNELDLALDIYQQMLSEGCTPNLVTFNTLLDVYAKTGHWAEALAVLDQLDMQGISPEPRTYNTVVAACNMSGHYEEALSVYERMLKKGAEPMPATYNAAVCALARLGRLPAALALLGAAAARGVDRGVTTYAALLSACEAPGRWDLALDLLRRMQEDGLKPTTACFNSAINACTRGGEPAKAEQLFERLYGVCKPDTSTFNALVRIYCQLGKVREAQGVLDMMAGGGQHVEAATYASLVDAAWATGALPMQRYALRLHARARARQGLAPPAVEDCAADASTRLVLPAPAPHAALISLLGLLRALRSQLAPAGGAPAGALRPVVRLSVPVQEELLPATEQVVLGVLCAMGSPLQPVPAAPDAGAAGAADAAAPAPESPSTAVLLASGAFESAGAAAAAAEAAAAAGLARAGPGAPSAGGGAAADGSPRDGGRAPPSPAAAAAARVASLELACGGAEFSRWLCGPAVGGMLSTLLLDDCPPPPGAPQPPPGQLPDGKAAAQDDAPREARCGVAMAAVQRFEAACPVDAQAMPPELLARHGQLVALLLAAAPLLGLPQEAGHDAALLLARAACSGALAGTDWSNPAAGRLLAAACLLLCAGPGGAAGAAPPGGGAAAAIEALTGAPPGAAAAAAARVRAALAPAGGAAAISALRVLRLYLERLGDASASGAAAPAAAGAALVAAPAAAASPAFLGAPPSLAAAALLFAGRLASGVLPAWPGALRALTGYECRLDDPVAGPLIASALELVLELPGSWAGAAA